MAAENSVTLHDLVSVLKCGDPREAHKKLEEMLDKMSEDETRAMIIRAVYTIDAINSIR